MIPASDARAWTGNLAIFRIGFVGWIALPAAFGALWWAESILPGLPAEAWRPISFFQLVPMSVLTDVSLARALALLNIGLLVLGLAGIRTSWTLGLAAVLSTYVLGLSQNQVKVTQNCHIVWFLALLAVGPSGVMLSCDAIVAAVRSGARGPALASPLALPTFRYIWVLFGLIFLMPGLAKLHSAIVDGWAGADHVRGIFWRQWLLVSEYETRKPPLVSAITALPSGLLELGGWLLIIFEIGFIGAVLIRPLRPLVAGAGLLFHAFTRVTMNIRFAMLIPAYVGLIDWAALVRTLRQRLGISRVHLPTPDTSGGRSMVAVLRALDVFGFFEPAESGREGSQPGRARARWLHVVGITLVVGQLVVSGVRVVSMRSEPADVAREASSQWSRWRWPFDAYPDFSKRRTEIDVWEVRLGLRDGGEIRVEPAAYARTYGSAANTAWLFEYALAEEDAERRRSEVLALVRAVLDRVGDETRAQANAVRLYAIRYRVAAREPERLGKRLLYAFTLEGEAPMMPDTRSSLPTGAPRDRR